MSIYITLHPETPQPRLIKQIVEQLRAGAVIAYPTDSSYALACHMGDKQALDRIRRIRQIDEKHHLTLVCRDLSEVANYAKVSNSMYRMLKNNTPGAYTFILQATREVPKRLQHPKKNTIGLHIPNHVITQCLLEELNEPMMSTSLILPGQEQALTEPWEINELVGHAVDVIVDGGYCSNEESTVVSLLDDVPEIIRVGQGDPSVFEV